MQFVPGVLESLTGGAAATGAVGGSSTIASILQGGASALSILSGIGASRDEATALVLDANDAEAEIVNEDIRGLQRRNSLKRAWLEAIGEHDAAVAATGGDVSFGSAVQVRKEAAQEADRALTLDATTTMQRGSRLQERARLFRIAARSRRRSGLVEGLAEGLGTAADIFERG